MKNIVESINAVNEGVGGIEVFQDISIPRVVAKIPAKRGAKYMWINLEGDCMALCTDAELEANFEDFELYDELKAVKALQVGETWSADNINVYLRIAK